MSDPDSAGTPPGSRAPPEPSAATPVTPLPATALYRRCDPDRLAFATTDELAPLDEILGQARAVEALNFGLGIRREGYNLFALGPIGTGKRSLIRAFTTAQARHDPAPSDWIYAHNFAEPQKPRAIRMPAGRGAKLRQDMRDLIEELRAAVPAAFETEDYRTRRHVIDGQFKEAQEKAFGEIEERAKQQSIGIIRTPLGMGLAPLSKGEVLTPEQFHALPEAEQQRFQNEMNEIQRQLQETIRKIPRWESERREKTRELNRDVTRDAVAHLLESVSARYADLPEVTAYLKNVGDDLIENAEEFLVPPPSGPPDSLAELATRRAMHEIEPFDRYRVNLLVERGQDGGAPVVEEDHPTLQNLVGRVDYRSQFGVLVTDFTLITPGALHLANGGYLLLDARRVLIQPYAWEELKRSMRVREIRIRSVGEMLGLASAGTLQPEPIPLDVKVVLMGDRFLYYLLAEIDPEFEELFKVAADFDDETERSSESEQAYARLIAAIAHREKLLALDREAVARVIEHGARIAGDSEKISTRIEVVADLLREADHLASGAGRQVILRGDVQAAIDAQIRRASRVRERILEEIGRGTILIDSGGARVGQVNGLSVLQLGGYSFGRPSRISAQVRLGKGEVVDIEREVELGGPIHSKGVLILTGFLGGRFARQRPLSLSVSLVFEQSYSGVEGDSASLAELCTILSALAAAPIRQEVALTGSINQNGEVQPIGGVNEKIEGFFDVCRLRGLSGRQGVIVPRANVKHLMLRHDVVEAAAAGKFHVWPVTSVDQAMAVLTGLESGERDGAGTYPPGTLNARVEAELAAMAERARSFATPERKG